MRRLRPGGALLAWCLAAAWTPVMHGADACSQYALRGVAPGMRLSDVRARLGAGSSVGTVRGEAGPRSSVTYAAKDTLLDVLYDRDIARDPEAHVVLVRARGPAKVTDPLAFVRSLVPSLGVPTQGGENLQDGFLSGSTIWKDETCRVEVTAYREQAEWWRPGERDISVRIESMPATQATPAQSESAAAAPTPSAPPPPSPEPAPVVLASRTEPEPEPQREREPELASEPQSANGNDEATPPKVIPASQVEPRYPLRAMVLRITASVTLRVQVKKDGSVGDVNVLDTTRRGMGFEEAAVEAVKKWLYTPASRNGEPEDAMTTVRLTFD